VSDEDGIVTDENLVDDPTHGTAADHPGRETQPFLVAPTTENAFNVLSLDLVAVACLKLQDILFEFDSSFPNRKVATMLSQLPALRERHRNARGVAPPLGIEPNLAWTADDDRIAWWIVGDDGGQLRGKADFRNDETARRGTKIEVFGTAEGDVLIQPTRAASATACSARMWSHSERSSIASISLLLTKCRRDLADGAFQPGHQPELTHKQEITSRWPTSTCVRPGLS
jgi:hypothetical protein